MNLTQLEAVLTDADPDVFALSGAASLDALAAAERALVGKGSPMARAKEAIGRLEPTDKPAAGRSSLGRCLIASFTTLAGERRPV